MDNPVAATELRCTQCGGELHPDEGQIFLTCPYCNAAIYLDKSKVVFHWYLAPTIDETKASAALARWMAGNQTVKNLDQKARLTGSSFTYFPIWYFKRRQKNNQEEILLEPAAATSVSELRRLRLPAGDLRKYEPSLDAQSQPPSVPLQAALNWLAERQIPQAELVEQALVHIPIYTYKYTYQGNPYTALVEAGTGEVFANIYPAKAEAPYQTIGCLTALVFLILASIPLISSLINGGSGLGIGLLICTGLAVVAAPILFGIATWVAAKI
jgi:DNA-directed RNA polymerase subunit RPC12/RpoP